jgi:hypothetical protein
VDLYPNPTAPLYPNSPVGENRSRQNLTWRALDACCAAYMVWKLAAGRGLPPEDARRKLSFFQSEASCWCLQ